MDAFEEIIGKLLLEEQYWVRHSVKINLTKEEKREISKPTTPRPEIDIIIYDLKIDTLYLLEVKSFLDSSGVKLDDIKDLQEVQTGRYKVLTSEKYQNVITKRLQTDWVNKGLIKQSTIISFGLVAGKVYQNKENEMDNYLKKKGWFFWGPTTVKLKLENLVSNGYENSLVTVVSKILLRDIKNSN